MVCAVRLLLLDGRADRQVRECHQGRGLVAGDLMRVAVQRKRDGRVPGKSLGRLGCNAPRRQVRDEPVPQSMEVEHPAGIVREATQPHDHHVVGRLPDPAASLESGRTWRRLVDPPST